MSLPLPTGRRGQMLALAMTLVAVALLWLATVNPLLAWKADLEDTRARRLLLAERMTNLVNSGPALQRQIDDLSKGPPLRAAIEGATDAIAAATLQGQLQDMARTKALSLASAEALPAEAVGSYRRIGLRLVVEGTWNVLIDFLQAVEQASPRMLVDDLQVQRGPVVVGAAPRLNASFSVFGFRAMAK